MKKKIFLSLGVVSLGIGGLIGGCGGGGATDLGNLITPTPNPEINGTALYCDNPVVVDLNDSGTQAAAALVAGTPVKRNISKDPLNPNAQNKLRRITAEAIGSMDNNGTSTGEGMVYPIVVSYAEQVIGDYELGDGSADIGDPTHIDDIFVSLSRDNGQTWKKYHLNNSAEKSSIQVKWAGETINYPGHSVKPDIAVSGNYILVAWQDKYCPSGNPLGFPLSDDPNFTYVDKWAVTGNQGSIDYTADDGTVMIAPNGKEVYEVPFSCVWTARGIFNTQTNEIDWMQPQQLTSGKRDAAKVWIAAHKDAGFAITWQEDPEGLRAGKGAGPGEGWSGATTNHGADIWYTYLPMNRFADINTSVELNATVPLYNFAGPVRITDNDTCSVEGDSKQYCYDPAICQASVATQTNNGQEADLLRCVTGDIDALGTYYPENYAILDGDTGASRPAMKLLKTDTGQVITYLGYEETKGLADSNPSDQTQGAETNISVEGKSVYIEMFPFDRPVTVSSGNIVNTKVNNAYYENARRIVLVNQVDACEQGNYTLGVLYKQGAETQGGSSDMFVRLSTGLSPDLSDAAVWSEPVNVSSHTPQTDENGTVIGGTWSAANLHDLATANPYENTFSPRGFMRGSNVFIGFEYTPNYAKAEQGNMPNNFYIHRKTGDNVDAFNGWQGPQNISMISGRKVSTLDPFFLPTPSPIAGSPVPGYGQGAAGVLFMTYGTYDMTSGEELDLYFTRSTDGGVTWSTVLNEQNITVNAGLSTVKEVEEKEVQAMASPDGSVLTTAWIQESEANSTASDHFKGLDSWLGTVDFNVTTE